MIRIEINTGNAAFADGNKLHEIDRILREASARMNRGNIPLHFEGELFRLYDVNGNRVGQVSVHQDND